MTARDIARMLADLLKGAQYDAVTPSLADVKERTETFLAILECAYKDEIGDVRFSAHVTEPLSIYVQHNSCSVDLGSKTFKIEVRERSAVDRLGDLA